MKIKMLIIFSLLCFSFNYSQSLKKITSFGQFENASSFSINMSGFIYITDSYSNELFKYDTLGNMLKFIGGYGWEVSQFDNPVDVYASTLNIYVADKNNDRIQIFDKDLNFLSSFTTKESENSDYQFAYPTACGVSGQGDLFILDSDNNRILKFNLTGDFLQSIGGIDEGNFTLDNPRKFTISKHGNIYVLDENRLVIFDQYGNVLTKLQLNFKADNINLSSNFLLLISSTKIQLLNLKDYIPIKNIDFNDISKINDATIFMGKLYVLSEHNILIYQFNNK